MDRSFCFGYFVFQFNDSRAALLWPVPFAVAARRRKENKCPAESGQTPDAAGAAVRRRWTKAGQVTGSAPLKRHAASSSVLSRLAAVEPFALSPFCARRLHFFTFHL